MKPRSDESILAEINGGPPSTRRDIQRSVVRILREANPWVLTSYHTRPDITATPRACYIPESRWHEVMERDIGRVPRRRVTGDALKPQFDRVVQQAHAAAEAEEKQQEYLKQAARAGRRVSVAAFAGGAAARGLNPRRALQQVVALRQGSDDSTQPG